jgi:hypothetical protein
MRPGRQAEEGLPIIQAKSRELADWIIFDDQAGTVIVDTRARDPILFTQPGQSGFHQERAVTQCGDMQTDASRDRMADCEFHGVEDQSAGSNGDSGRLTAVQLGEMMHGEQP